MTPEPLMPEATSAGTLLTSATERLRGASPTPRLDAELLVSHAFGRDRAWLHAHPEAVLGEAGAAGLAARVERRAEGEPIAYIRGFKEWLSLRVATDPRALIPRPETELLAEAAMAEIAVRLARDDEPFLACEVATGSGAITLAVALRFREALAATRLRLVASDISQDAVDLAAVNLAAHGLNAAVWLACGDLLDAATPFAPAPADVVIANLPYVPTAEAAAANGSLRYEPRAALDGGPDGMALIRRLLEQLPVRLARRGVALLEIGAGQASAVSAAVERLDMPATVSTLMDLAGAERVVRIARA